MNQLPRELATGHADAVGCLATAQRDRAGWVPARRFPAHSAGDDSPLHSACLHLDQRRCNTGKPAAECAGAFDNHGHRLGNPLRPMPPS
jgi:hypothetical protein